MFGKGHFSLDKQCCGPRYIQMSVDVVDVVTVILGIVPILEEILETSHMLSRFYESLLRITTDPPE